MKIDIISLYIHQHSVYTPLTQKKRSSRWVKTWGSNYANFYWQSDYGIFSVNPSEVEVVIRYIRNQEKHHKTRTFQEEYRAFLNKYHVEYDERYVWD